MKQWIACIAMSLVSVGPSAMAQTYDTPEALRQAFQEGQRLESTGRHYGAAVVFFNVYTGGGELQDVALSKLTESLIRGGLYNAASYFYIKTLQSGDKNAIRRVLQYLPEMIDHVGGDLLRKYVLNNTGEADYDADSRNHFHYFLGKDELLKGDAGKALQALSRVSSGSGVVPRAAYLRGAAYAMLGQAQNAISSFQTCRRLAPRSASKVRSLKRETEDLEARCTAGLARAYYQAGDFARAEETYDDIPKTSFVWTDILFEQAWNAYAKGDFNRTLGKLVTYRSPDLSFVFNPEVDVLRAQSFLGLCHYEDVNRTVNEFNSRYAGVGGQIKNFLLSHDRDLQAYYPLAKRAFHAKLHTGDLLTRALNRFVRGPYFASLVAQERATQREDARIRQLANEEARDHNFQQGFGGFLDKVLDWRQRSIRLLGGMFVKNSMVDLYQDLLSNLDRMSFIKLEMLKQTKSRLEKKDVMSEDEDGVMKRGKADIARRDHQYFWTFNGEFWADELGDYVFSLENECGG